jgi:hypothetical protein
MLKNDTFSGIEPIFSSAKSAVSAPRRLWSQPCFVAHDLADAKTNSNSNSDGDISS